MTHPYIPAYLTTKLITHTQRVKSLYKRSQRMLDSYFRERAELRFNACCLRKRFDDHKDEKDMRIAKQLLVDGEEELFNKAHIQPTYFPNSPKGINYGRVVPSPDWVLDYWHPLEKAQYPKYFATREIRKKQYVQNWEKEFGKPDPSETHH